MKIKKDITPLLLIGGGLAAIFFFFKKTAQPPAVQGLGAFIASKSDVG